VERAKDFIVDWLSAELLVRPLRTYLVAARLSLKKIAEEAALVTT